MYIVFHCQVAMLYGCSHLQNFLFGEQIEPIPMNVTCNMNFPSSILSHNRCISLLAYWHRWNRKEVLVTDMLVLCLQVAHHWFLQPQQVMRLLWRSCLIMGLILRLSQIAPRTRHYLWHALVVGKRLVFFNSHIMKCYTKCINIFIVVYLYHCFGVFDLLTCIYSFQRLFDLANIYKGCKGSCV